jgi:hydroxyethylthiazole kinase
MINSIQANLSLLRQTKPVILCLTNYVTMDFMANNLLALGALPIMSSCDEELDELIHISHAITINLGTLDSSFIKRCHQACLLAKTHRKPIVLDPVGAGASHLRTQSARELMKHASIIRGNASEIKSLVDDNSKTLGVESSYPTDMAKKSARQLAERLGSTVIISGPEDFITDGSRQDCLNFGSALMPLITGMGCALTAVTAAFLAVIPDSFIAAQLATAYFGLCGNAAHLKTTHPGTFRSVFIDELYAANFDVMRTILC